MLSKEFKRFISICYAAGFLLALSVGYFIGSLIDATLLLQITAVVVLLVGVLLTSVTASMKKTIVTFYEQVESNLLTRAARRSRYPKEK